MARYFGKQIIIDGSRGNLGQNSPWRGPTGSAHYERDVQQVLHRIKSYRIGRALLHGINRGQPCGQKCTIVPAEYDNPGSTMTTPLRNNQVGCPRGNPSATVSSVVITYNPWTWYGRDNATGIDPNRTGYFPDDVLFHELVHAFLKMIGLFRSRGRGRFDDFHNREDFYAVLFTNIYRSERNRTASQRSPLRGNHELTFQNMAPNLANSSRFYQQYSVEIDALFKVENYQPGKKALTDFIDAVRGINCSFNPIRAWTKTGIIPLDSGAKRDWGMKGL